MGIKNKSPDNREGRQVRLRLAFQWWVFRAIGEHRYMGIFRPRAMTFVDACVYGPGGRMGNSLRVADGQVAAVDCAPEREDLIIRSEGALILPGLINAHDHLELNNFPRLKWRNQYANASEWIADFQPRFGTDPALMNAMSVPLGDRLLLGGIKNLLSGVTTVCHHNPLYRQLQRGFPVRVVRRYRHSHSLLIDGDAVQREYQDTPADWPWIIHAAEGTDAAAAAEFEQLNRWGCLGGNSIIVHGVALGKTQQNILIDRGGALILCPSSNDFLLGATADISLLSRAGRVALGTDSRLSGGRDLLAEMNHASARHSISAKSLLPMVTEDAAAILRLSDAGALRPGAPADLVAFPPSSAEPLDSVLTADRSRIRLIMVGGRAQVGDPGMLSAFEVTNEPSVVIRIDQREKLMAKKLADKMKRCTAREPGLEL